MTERNPPALPGKSLKILMVHNYYSEGGGENESFEAEAALLESRDGTSVVRYTRHNDEVKKGGFKQSCTAAVQMYWSRTTRREISNLLDRESVDVAHFQNTFPLISSSGYGACRERDIPIVQTLRNYRLKCNNAYLFRDGAPCELCIERDSVVPGIKHRCYEGSFTKSVAVGSMIAMQQRLKVWNEVDLFISPSLFARDRFVACGIPEEKIIVKPNFLDSDPGLRVGDPRHILYVGKLAPAKGVMTLLRAWESVESPLPLSIVGPGPLLGDAQAAARRSQGRIEVQGPLPHPRVLELMRQAYALVFPSEAYETFGRVAMEAFACGVPVIASGHGALGEIVEDGVNGLHFEPGDPASLSERLQFLIDHPGMARDMGSSGRRTFEDRYGPDPNYRQLMDIYLRALGTS